MKRSERHRILKFAAVSSFAVGVAAFCVNNHATQRSTRIAVTATVVPSCVVRGSAERLVPALLRGANFDATNVLGATCTVGSIYAIGLSRGLGGSWQSLGVSGHGADADTFTATIDF